MSAEESKVKWYKDGEILNETDQHYEFKSTGRKHSIVIKNATVHHEGEYVASVGEQECSCELTVIGKIFYSKEDLLTPHPLPHPQRTK